MWIRTLVRGSTWDVSLSFRYQISETTCTPCQLSVRLLWYLPEHGVAAEVTQRASETHQVHLDACANLGRYLRQVACVCVFGILILQLFIVE